MSHNLTTFNDNEPDRDSRVTAGTPLILIGAGESNAYSNSSATGLGANTNLYFYDSSPLNTISGATLTGSSGWYSSVTLPAGEYIIESCFNCDFTASGILRHAIRMSSNRTAYGSIGDTADLEDGGCIAFTYIDISSATSVDFRVVSSSNTDTVANQGNTVSEQSWVFIRKIG